MVRRLPVSERAAGPSGIEGRNRLALQLIRLSTLVFTVSLIGLGVWHTATGRDAVRWPGWFAFLALVLVVSSVMGWPRRQRPAELRFLLLIGSVLQAIPSTSFATFDERFLPASILSCTCVALSVVMRSASP